MNAHVLQDVNHVLVPSQIHISRALLLQAQIRRPQVKGSIPSRLMTSHRCPLEGPAIHLPRLDLLLNDARPPHQYQTVITYWSLQTQAVQRRLEQHNAYNAFRSIPLHFNVICVRKNLHEPTTCVRISAPTPTSAHSFAQFAPKRLLDNMIASDTRVCIAERRSLYAGENLG